jgi:WD40 repeat protein
MTSAPELPDVRYALVVATGEYRDAAFRQLRAPAQDASDMISVLSDPEIGGFNVTSLIDQPEHEIRREMGTFLAGRRLDDIILLYLSCHGVLDPRGRLHFAAVDSDKAHLPTTALAATLLLDLLEECRARRQVVILDCCFSGGFTNAKGDDELGLEERLLGSGRGRIVLTACRAGEYSFEGESIPGVTVSRSVFTEALVDGLRSGKADRTGDGYISVDEAFTYAVDQMQARNVNQSPQKWLYAGEGEIILARNPRGLSLSPAQLPPALLLSLESPYPPVRQAAVTKLAELLSDADPRLALAARQTLQRIASSDVPLVAGEARKAMHGPAIPSPRTAPEQPRRDAGAGTAAAPAPAARTTAAPGGQAVRPVERRPATPVSTADRPTRPSKVAPAATTKPAESAVPQHLLRTLSPYGRGNPPRPVEAVTFSPTGKLLVSGGADEKVRLWNPETGALVKTLEGHTSWVRAVAVSPDGRLIASGGGDGTVRLWNIETGALQIPPLYDHLYPVTSVAFSPDEELLASGGEDGLVRLWRTQTGEPVEFPQSTVGPHIRSLAFSPDGQLLAIAREDDTIEIWDPCNGEPTDRRLTGHTHIVTSLAISPDNEVLAAASLDTSIRLWNLVTGEPAWQPLNGHQSPPASLAFSPDGALLAAADGKVVRLWNWQRGAEVCRPLSGHDGMVKSVAFSPDGQLLATAGDDAIIGLWQA